MATQTLVPDAILTSSGGASPATTSMLAAQDASFFAASGVNVSTVVDADFPSPSGAPNSGASLQTITVQAKKLSTNSGTPTMAVTVGYNSGGTFQPVFSLTGPTWSVTSTTGQLFTFQFNFADFVAGGGAADGSNLVVHVSTTGVGGSPSVRNSVSVGYVAWTVDYSVAVGGRPKVFLAGSWQAKPLKLFIGGAWVEKPVKVHSGGSWVLA